MRDMSLPVMSVVLPLPAPALAQTTAPVAPPVADGALAATAGNAWIWWTLVAVVLVGAVAWWFASRRSRA